MVDFRFAKLYTRIQEGESFQPSIVAFGSVPLEVRDEFQKNGMMKVVPFVWGRRLYINLWFVVLNFSWKKEL